MSQPDTPPGASLGAIDDPSIPVLTDRIFLPAIDLDTALPPALLPTETADEDTTRATHSAAAQGSGDGGNEGLADAQDAAADRAAFAMDDVEASNEPESADAATGAEVVSSEAAIEAEADREPAAVGPEPPATEPELAAQDLAVRHDRVIGVEALGHAAAEGAQAARIYTTPFSDDQALAERGELLRTAVLRRVRERLPEQIDATVRDLMQPAIEQAMARLAEEAQVALRITLQDLVEQVLREELSRHSEDTSQR